MTSLLGLSYFYFINTTNSHKLNDFQQFIINFYKKCMSYEIVFEKCVLYLLTTLLPVFNDYHIIYSTV